MAALQGRRLCVFFFVGVSLLSLGGVMIPVVDYIIREKIKEVGQGHVIAK
jgi:hypothetical protein